VLASNGDIHEELLATIRSVFPPDP
jgi:hypothetical protein